MKPEEPRELEWESVVPPDFEGVPDKPGIYMICTLQKVDGKYEVKYVGQAEDLYVRGKEHWSRHEKNERLRKHIAEKYVMKFCFAEVFSKKDRDGIELYLYELYDPLYNHSSPHAEAPIKCVIPQFRRHR